MKNFAASTAIVLAFAAPGFAQAQTSGAFVNSIEDEALRASDLMGARLYVSEAEVDAAAGQADDWDDVGEISDIIVGSSGGVDAVLVDIGGFLGMGERTVAVNMDDLQFVSDGEDADEFFVVLQSDKAMLESAPEFDPEFQMGRSAEMVDTDMGNGTAAVPTEQGTGATTQSADATDMNTQPEVSDTAEADVAPIAEETDAEMANGETAVPVPGAGTMGRPAIEVEGYDTIESTALTTDDVTGARVYGVNDEDIGEVGDLVMSDDGTLQDAIIDVGGFLGLGEKPVAIPFDQLQVMRGEDDVRLYIDATEDQLKAMPNYEG